MRLTRIFAPGPLAVGMSISLPASSSNHVVRVLRLREGAPLVLFDGKGGEYRAEISRVSGSHVQVLLHEFVTDAVESGLQLTLVQGVSRSERMDWTLQKATELGVTLIVPVLTARSVVRLDAGQALKKLAHWQAIVISACEQCGRTRVPAVTAPVSLTEFLAAEKQEGLRLSLSPGAPTSLPELAAVAQQIELLIGPEGGLDDDEQAQAARSGYLPVRLGPRILRTETAAVVALSVLQAMWGDLR